ncbi:MAG: hypothetical protein ACLUUO_16120 [Sellimonas intestinalis]
MQGAFRDVSVLIPWPRTIHAMLQRSVSSYDPKMEELAGELRFGDRKSSWRFQPGIVR